MIYVAYTLLGAFAALGAFGAGFLLGLYGRPVRRGGSVDLTGMRAKGTRR